MLAAQGYSPRHLADPAEEQPQPSTSAPDRGDGDAKMALAGTRRRDLDVAVMGPPPPRKKPKMVVLEEDAYTTAIERIIERDFFPDLPKLQDRLAWLEAVRSGSAAAIQQAQLQIARRRAERKKLGYNTPSIRVTDSVRTGGSFRVPDSVRTEGTQATPSAAAAGPSGNGAPDDSNVDMTLSLDAFMTTYTSEDNDSFQRILENMQQRQQRRWDFLLEKDRTQLEKPPQDNRTSIEGFGASGQPVGTLISWPYEAKNRLMYDSSNHTVVPLTDEERAQMLKGEEKVISYRSTRFIVPKAEQAAGTVDAEVAYDLVPGATPQWRPPPNNEKVDLAAMRQTPKYEFVKTPSPAPGVDESPFMTWGDVEGTPLRLEAEDTPIDIGGAVNMFKVPATPLREKAGMLLARKAGRSLQSRRLGGRAPVMTPTPGSMHRGGTPGSVVAPSPSRTPGSSTPGGLSAAGQRLARQHHMQSARGLGLDAQLRNSYSGQNKGQNSRVPRRGDSGWDSEETPLRP
eukprot:jgi/Chlat1/7775/Chrsp66S07243